MTLRDVLAVCPAGDIGGAEQWLLAILVAAPSGSLPMRAIVLENGPFPAALRAAGVPVAVRPVGPRRTLAGGAFDIARRIRRTRPDVVLANGVKAAALAVPAALLARTPVVWMRHDNAFTGPLVTGLSRMATDVAACAPSVGIATGRSDFVWLPPPLPVDPAPRDEAAAFWRGHGVASGSGSAHTAVYVGRLDPWKGIDDAVRALAQPAGAGWRLVVVGADTPARPGEGSRLAALAARLGVAERVVFTGAVAGAGRMLAAFDALVLLTKAGGEGFPTAGLEALAAGVPVVVTEGASTLDIAGAAGWAVPPGNPMAVALALREIGRDGAAASAATAAAERLKRDHPTAADLAARLRELLASAASSTRRD